MGAVLSPCVLRRWRVHTTHTHCGHHTLRGLVDKLLWVEDITDNLIPTEVPTPAEVRPHQHTFLRIRIRNILRKWQRSRGNIVSSLTFLEDRHCDVCLRTKITKASCRRRTGEALPRAEKFGDLITADHKVLDEDVNPAKITGALSWCKILPPNGFQSYPCKNKIFT